MNPWNGFQQAVKGLVPSSREAARFWKAWAKGTWPDKLASMLYHRHKHGKGRTLLQYIETAIIFWNNNKHLAQWGQWNPKWTPSFRLKIAGRGGYFSGEGEILTYWD